MHAVRTMWLEKWLHDISKDGMYDETGLHLVIGTAFICSEGHPEFIHMNAQLWTDGKMDK